MDFIEFSRSEILLLSQVLRLVRKETGLPLKMQSDNFLKRLDTAMTACRNPKTHKLYHEFLSTFSQQDILEKLSITGTKKKTTNTQTVTYRDQEKTTEKTKPTDGSKDNDEHKGKRKIVYRGQVKYVD